MSTSPLFHPLSLGELTLPQRVVMAPMTRSRTAQPGDVPTPMMAEYYGQRAGAGLIISEATQISPQGKGYSFTPGIYSQAQIDGWKQVTDAVHHNGGRIFLQLWHVGRMSHPSLHADGQPVAPSALAPDAQVWIVGDDGIGRMLDCPVPRALTTDEIHATVEDYRQAALNAMAAGFDGVEIHGGNGYLIDQFLRRSANQRTDAYGGSQANRIRFVTEVTESISDAIGADKVGVRLAPFITQRGMDDSEAIDTILLAAGEFNRIGIAYLHLAEADWDDAPTVSLGFRRDLRAAFSGAIVVAGNYHKASAEALINEGLVDAVAFGRAFIANPDLPFRMQRNLPLADIGDPSTLFGGNHKGYTDYPDYHQQLKQSLI
ncbi:alkene reductase [Ferrimonas sp. SCSIO 43195]|uniref:alkene reductase n=1 Tax=Ferrimonas sp. SCSIO 43195 TaxID=2822844 RepID=UPI0020758B99|nr:alkene reductase [Ferrimonas sp. SCSIO 43195]USD35943.1 alkene reductase [Ferrimonas sp. SCSIO 43195]